MSILRILPFAAIMAVGAFGLTARAAEDPHAAHAAQGGVPAGGPGAASGAHGGGMHDMMMQHMREMRENFGKEHKSYAEVLLKYIDELKLSDEQIGKITRIHRANQSKMEQLGKRFHETLKAAHDVYLNPASDEGAIRKAAKEHSAVFDEMIETTLKTRNAINAILTPEQLKQLQAPKSSPE